eukprot:gene17236-5001_t
MVPATKRWWHVLIAFHLIASLPQNTCTIASPVANICSTNSAIGIAVINAVNLSFPGLEAVRDAAAAGVHGEACELLANYYKQGNTSAWLRLAETPTPSTRRSGGDGDDLVEHDIFHLQGVDEVAIVPRNKDHGIDWYDKGPKEDPEFMNCLNRHDAFTRLLASWVSTGNPVYPAYFSNLVSDWVSHLPCREGVSRAQ